MKELSETSRRISEEVAASSDEILSAIEALTEGELVKLERYAKYRIKGLGRRARGRDHEDLLREAITATFAGNRRWNPGAVRFFAHLIGVMRSLSSHWAEQFDPEEAYLESELVPADESSESGRLENEPSTIPSAERQLSAREELQQIERYFSDDPLVARLLGALREGLSGPEIRAQLGLTKRAFETGMKRLRRGVSAMERDGGAYAIQH